jgi:hypothetical protein
MGSDTFRDPAYSGHSTDDPPHGMPVESLTRAVDEDRAVETLADREVEGACDPGCQRDRDDLAAFADHDTRVTSSRSAKYRFIGTSAVERIEFIRDLPFVAEARRPSNGAPADPLRDPTVRRSRRNEEVPIRRAGRPAPGDILCARSAYTSSTDSQIERGEAGQRRR